MGGGTVNGELPIEECVVSSGEVAFCFSPHVGDAGSPTG